MRNRYTSSRSRRRRRRGVRNGGDTCIITAGAIALAVSFNIKSNLGIAIGVILIGIGLIDLIFANKKSTGFIKPNASGTHNCAHCNRELKFDNNTKIYNCEYCHAMFSEKHLI